MKRLISCINVPAGALFALAGLCIPSYAQAPVDATTLTPYVTGLQGPRGLTFGSDGQLYVAEAGTGGTNSTGTSCIQVPSPIGPYTGGPTARISKIDSTGNRTTLASGLPSALDATGDILGVADVTFLNGELYALVAGGGCSHGNPTLPAGIVRVNAQSGTWNYVSDLSTFYAEHPSEFPDKADFEPDGSSYGMTAYHGSLFSTEPNHGLLVRTTPQGTSTIVSDISAHFGHIVPTGILAANDNLYVVNLGQFPVTPNWDKLLTFSRDLIYSDPTTGMEANTGDPRRWKLAAVRAGLTASVSVKMGPDGLIYVLELTTAAGDPTPGTGKVLRLNRDGVFVEVVTNLTVPTGMTFGPDGALYISNLGAAASGAGTILRVELPN